MKFNQYVKENWVMQSQRPFTVSWIDAYEKEVDKTFSDYNDAFNRLQYIKNSINPQHKKEAEAIRWTLRKIDSVEDAE